MNRLRTLNVTRGATLVHGYEYKLRASGHRRQIIEGSKTTTFTYDELYRLTGEAVAGGAAAQNGNVTYGLDKVGNRESRLSSITSVGSGTSTFDSRDWLSGDTYDANGNTLTSPITVYGSPLSTPDVYDFEDRLIIRHKPDGSSVNLSYDADGILRQKTVLSPAATLVNATGYLTDGQNPTGYAQVLEERVNTAAGTTVKTYAYGSDLISRTVATSNGSSLTSYFLYDGLASVRELTNESGAVTDSYTYDAFGILTDRTGVSDNPYLYRGERFETEIGQYYLRARFYNQASGRFWNQDIYEGSFSDPISLHKYLYANVDPVGSVDPSGWFSLVELQTVVADIGTLTRMTLPVIRAANAMMSALDFLSLVREVSLAITSGQFQGLIRKQVQSSLNVLKGIGIEEVTESLLYHTPTLLTASLPVWGPWIAAEYSQIDRYVIYMPTAPGVPYFEIPMPAPRRLSKKLVLGFGAGVEENKLSKKAGRLTGIGVGLSGQKNSKQIWRMDIHPAHEQKGDGDLAYFEDWPFHYHVSRPF